MPHNSYVTCESCGANVELPANFCDMCGSRLAPVSKRPMPSLQRGGESMAENQVEKTYVNNPFGQVTDRRAVYYRKKGWFSGGSREDVPLKHVTSVRVEITRHVFWGGVLVLVGLATLASRELGIIIGGVLVAGVGVLLLWGSPTVVVNTAGGDLEAMKGWPWHRQLAEEFLRALRSQLFKD